MLARTLTLWRRLVGQQPPADESPVEQDERRLWVRYYADPAPSVQVAPADNPAPISAVIRDISLGGASLLVERAFHAGQILSLELPATEDEQQVILACVVRAAPEGNARWLLGCVFARELVQEDLNRLGARKVKSGRNDKRTWVRHACKLRAVYQQVGDPDETTHNAEVLNISASGVGLKLGNPLEAGSLISIDLYDTAGQTAHTMLACVVHTTRRANGDLSAGCNFIRELTEDELRALL
jgi:c-di-GMP-binding flagellar brake protein YcgR